MRAVASLATYALYRITVSTKWSRVRNGVHAGVVSPSSHLSSGNAVHCSMHHPEASRKRPVDSYVTVLDPIGRSAYWVCPRCAVLGRDEGPSLSPAFQSPRFAPLGTLWSR